MDNPVKLVIFNVNQQNVRRCIKAQQTGLKAKKAPPYLSKGVLCFLRQTSRGEDPKNYGVVGVYKIESVQSHNPALPIKGWIPQTGWANIVNMKELFVLPQIFHEEFSIDTEVLRHKRSKYVRSLMNKDIQGDSRVINEPAATDYLDAIEKRYPQLREQISNTSRILKSAISIDSFVNEQETKQRQARKLTDKELWEKLSKANMLPSKREIVGNGYVRNEHVAEFVQRRAKGICDLCEKEAPFKDQYGEPFLEEHHIIWLSKGGEDTTSNAVALCPNCHRKMHILNLDVEKEKLAKIASARLK